MRQEWRAGRWLVLLAVLIGCDSRPLSPSAESDRVTPPAATPSASPAADDAAPAATNGSKKTAAEQQVIQQPAPVTATPAGPPAPSPDSAVAKPAPAAKLEKATVGVGKKGHGYGGGIITEPVRARFRVEERIIFNNVDYALKLYKAQHGELPKTHEEFMEKIIRANQIALPTLPAGDEYLYDPDKGELMVRHQQ